MVLGKPVWSRDASIWSELFCVIVGNRRVLRRVSEGYFWGVCRCSCGVNGRLLKELHAHRIFEFVGRDGVKIICRIPESVVLGSSGVYNVR